VTEVSDNDVTETTAVPIVAQDSVAAGTAPDASGAPRAVAATDVPSAVIAKPGAPSGVFAAPIAAEVTTAASDDVPSLDQLEQEGDIAADYIEEFLDICDLDGDIDIDARNGRAYLSVNGAEGANLRLLSKPETVTALQELTRLAVQNKTGSFSRLILDIGGSREAREAELSDLVEHAIIRITSGATSAALPPMSSYERKLVHDIASGRGYSSESEGEGRDRHTVISAL